MYDAHLKKKKHEKTIELRVVRLPWQNENVFNDADYRDCAGNKNDIDQKKVLNEDNYNYF